MAIKLEAVPLLTVISPSTKPVTLSLKKKVTSMGETLVGLVIAVLAVIDGARLSYVIFNVLLAALPFVAASAALLAATLTLTMPCPTGVISAV